MIVSVTASITKESPPVELGDSSLSTVLLEEPMVLKTPEAMDPDDPAQRLAYLGRMVSAVGHELNNRLTSLLGFLELLAGKEDPRDVMRLLQKVQAYGEQLRYFTAGISGFTGRFEGRKTPVDLMLILRQGIDLAACQAKEQGVQVRFECLNQPWFVPAVAGEVRLGFFAILFHCSELISKLPIEVGPKLLEIVCKKTPQGRVCVELLAPHRGQALKEAFSSGHPALALANSVLAKQGFQWAWSLSGLQEPMLTYEAPNGTE